jgi:chaperone BCS1
MTLSHLEKVRQLEVTTRSFGSNAHGVTVPGETDDPLSSSRKLAYLPSAGHTYRIWYKRHHMTIEREVETVGYRRMEKLRLWYGSLCLD